MNRWRALGSRSAVVSSKYANSAESVISKLDSAKLKLSKYEQKYGRKGSAKTNDNGLPHSNFGVNATSLYQEPVQERRENAIELSVPVPVRKRDAEARNVDQLTLLDESSDSYEETGSDRDRLRTKKGSLQIKFFSRTNESKRYATDLNTSSKALTSDEQGLETSTGSAAKPLPTQETESSLSEIMENVHSVSSLEVKSQPSEEKIPAELKQLQLILPKNESLEVSLGDDSTRKTLTYSMESVEEVSTDSLTERSEELLETFANVRLAEELSDSETKPYIRLQFSPLTPVTEKAIAEISVPVPVPVVEVDQDFTIGLPVSREGTTSSSQNMQPLASPSSSTLKSNDKSVPATLISEKAPVKTPSKTILRDAEVQTERTRCRKVQVNLSTMSSTTDMGTAFNAEKLTCPIVSAVSLPKTVLNADEESSDPLSGRRDVMPLEDAVHDLMKSQLQLTVGLLRRQHSLYLSSCGSAVRLERGYNRETLSATRQFIRREKRLRELRRSKRKLRSE